MKLRFDDKGSSHCESSAVVIFGEEAAITTSVLCKVEVRCLKFEDITF